MESNSRTPNEGSLEQVLQSRIDAARNSALKMDNYNEKIEGIRAFREREKQGEVLTSEEEVSYQNLIKEIATCEVMVKTIVEFKKLLELLIPSKERIEELLNHENAHAITAIQLPSKEFVGYKIRFVRSSTGGLGFAVLVTTRDNMEFPLRQRLEEDIMLAEAPTQYEGKLSGGDKRRIEKTKSKLSEIPHN